MKEHRVEYEEFIHSELIDNHLDGVLAIDSNGKVFFCNSFFSEILNIKEEEILGKNIVNIIPNHRLEDTFSQKCSTWGEIVIINGREVVIKRYPIITNGIVKGAVVKTIFPNMNIAREVSSKIINNNSISNLNYNNYLHTCMDIIGESETMLFVKKLARKASRSVSNLLLTGESGTGKTILAEAIHNRSVRREAPFVKINCAAIPSELLESELFGYEEGAFTGAKKKGKLGKFELANGGTLFLDEIGDMPLYMQAKLLQAIQDKRIERVGGNVTISLNVRIIAATNKDLEKMIKENKFREDLYYRLKVLEIRMPALREIPEDIPLFVNGILEKMNKKLGTNTIGFTSESMEQIKRYSWLGNIRELENFIEQAMNYCYDEVVDVYGLPVKPWEDGDIANLTKIDFDNEGKNLNNMMSEIERDLIINTIKACNGNKTKAAEKLNIHRSVLYKKLKRLNISI